jgi:hypothetical protein
MRCASSTSDALSSSVGFKVDFDMALLVLASGLYRLMASRMRGYDDAQARLIFRDIIDMPADVAIADGEVRVRFHRRAHLPIVLASGILDKPIAVPWWNGYSLRFVQNRPSAAGIRSIPVRGNPGYRAGKRGKGGTKMS